MIQKITFSFCLLFINTSIFSQEERLIHGKIIAKNASPKGISVLNVATEKETVSDQNGEFSILANPDDVLLFASEKFETQRKIVEMDIYNAKDFTIEMTPKAVELEEVNIENINALSLGVISTPSKKYSPAERRLKTAGEFKPIHLLNLLGGTLPLDPIINAISGRTSNLRKEVKIEQKEAQFMKVGNLFEDSVFTEELHISKDEVVGFRYFIIENNDFVKALDANDETMMLFLMHDLVVNYQNRKNEK